MRILISLLLSIVVYSIIVYFLIFFLFPAKKAEKKVYIHTAILAKKAKINLNASNSKNIKKTTV